MGQRLVITVKKDAKRVATLYFHWSAYSVSALTETRDLLNYLLDDDNANMDVRLVCIRYAEQNHGGIDGGFSEEEDSEWQYVQNIFPNETFKKNDINRTHGLVAISEKDMDEMHAWSEGDVIIDFDSKTISYCVYNEYLSLETLNDEQAEWYDYDEDLFTPFTEDDVCDELKDVDLDCFNFDDIDFVIDVLDGSDARVFKTSEAYITLIA